jgi:O-antigen ligase
MNFSLKILPYLLFFTSLILPLKPEFTTIPFILITIIWFINSKKNTIWEKENLKIILFTTSTFIIGLIGLINTNNFDEAFFELSRTLPIFLLPFILFTIKQTFTNKTLSIILGGFILGSLSKTIFILIVATIKYFETGSYVYFFYVQLSKETNSFSYYLILAYYIILFAFYKKNILSGIISQRLQNNIALFSLVLFSIVIILLQTKAIIVYFFIINIIFLILYFKQKEGKILIIMLIISTSFIFIFSNEMRFISFFKEEKVKVENKAAVLPGKSEQSPESTSLRYNSIITTIAIIKENFLFGVGTGDLTDEMSKKYNQFGFIYNLKEQTNPHNQYLRTFGKNGILGIVTLLAFFIFIFYTWQKNKSPLLLALNLIVLLNCMTNDLFDTGGGAPFIGLMLPLIFLWSQNNTKSIIDSEIELKNENVRI